MMLLSQREVPHVALPRGAHKKIITFLIVFEYVAPLDTSNNNLM